MRLIFILLVSGILISSAVSDVSIDEKQLVKDAKNRLESNDLKALDKSEWPKQAKHGFLCPIDGSKLKHFVIEEKEGGSGCDNAGHGTHVKYCEKDKIYFIYKWSGGFVFRQDFYGPFNFPVNTDSSTSEKADFDVHEWGVFRFYQGAGADLLSGLDNLPSFVVRADRPHDKNCDCDKCQEIKAKCPACGGIRGKCMCLHKKKEKPVINFFTQDKIKVKVSVTEAHGNFIVWYPKETSLNKDGNKISWDVTVDGTLDSAKLRSCSGWWDIARDTESAYVKSKDGDTEKFIFYESNSAKYEPDIKINRDKGSILIESVSSQKYQGMFIVQNSKVTYLEKFEASFEVEAVKTISKEKALDKLHNLILNEGLSEKEAKGIVKIWEKDFFEKEGFRVIYMVPRKEVDKVLPLEITPKPKSIKRAMIAVVEDTGIAVEKLLKKLGDNDPKVRDAATDALIRIGKAAKSHLERALKAEKDPEVKSRLERILAEIGKSKGAVNEKDSKFIKEGVCKCDWKNIMLTADVGTCQRCGHWTSSGALKLCKNCSSELGVCSLCWKKNK